MEKKSPCLQSPECIHECVVQQPVKIKKKCNRNPLLPNYRESMVMEVSQRKNYYLGGCAIEDTLEKCLNCKSRAQRAAIASHEPVELSSALVLESDTLDNSTGIATINGRQCLGEWLQLLGLMRQADCFHEEQLYLLCHARYLGARAVGIRHREAELEAPQLGLWLGMLHQSLIVLPILESRTSRGLSRMMMSYMVALVSL